MSISSATRKRARNFAGTALLVALCTTGVAQAASVGVDGGAASASNSGSKLTIKDNRADGYAAYANWNSSGNNRIQTANRQGATASVTPNPLRNFRACLDQGTLNPDNCSSYVTP